MWVQGQWKLAAQYFLNFYQKHWLPPCSAFLEDLQTEAIQFFALRYSVGQTEMADKLKELHDTILPQWNKLSLEFQKHYPALIHQFAQLAQYVTHFCDSNMV